MLTEELLAKARPIRLAVFDVDGVLTTGKLFYSPQGIEYKEFNVYDGQGLKFLNKSGIQLGVITACTTSIVTKRMQDLGITHIYQGIDKITAYEDLKKKLNLTDEQIAYVGDDLPDLPVICRAGLGITVPHAPQVMRDHAAWITTAPGGRGAVREVCDLIMRAQGSYDSLIQAHLQR